MSDSLPIVTRYMPVREALYVLMIADKRLFRPMAAAPAPHMYRHGIRIVDNADTFATMSVMGLCNHIDGGVAARARSILDAYVRRQPQGHVRAVG